MKRIATRVALAVGVLYLATWIFGVPAVRRAVPQLLAKELASSTPPQERNSLTQLLRAHPPVVEFRKIYVAFPGIVVAHFDVQLGKRYFPGETRVVVWFGGGASLLNGRRV